MRPRPVIDLGEVVLRRWRPEDFETLFRLIEESLDHLRMWLPWAAGHSSQTTADTLARHELRWEQGEAYNYAIVHRGTVVGSCSLFGGAEPGGWEVGYWLHPAATGHGLATVAVTALTEQAFALPQVAYVEIVHDAANAASGAVARRAGFHEVGRRTPQPPPAPGDDGVDVVWRLSRPARNLTRTVPGGRGEQAGHE
ncbi:RimJ/RimL family protein N-acetyltransferase [Streptosporangium becharense]|uniref:RimJ/RimL family protein N-acetyltransferase n=1 Tax=Streptosporangium becharense TaxID=1816182 RepID=A0A7W9IDJ8_9ACTN|nr:GNAT family N-acetyltransferase [Streptosporangium becharense]MBB2913007.1 RimJ/RimL family protein N-acetyltransferase [Streptosporangium becharense]MBB5818168.1 RimJ/RimL family protein N-acetyltransferase [Streptosporangium becharense]